MTPTSVGTPWMWAGFLAFVAVMLALDLGVFHRRAHVVRYKEALVWTVVWISLSLLFALGVGLTLGGRAATEFLTGYFIEKSLSVDNVFVFVVVFATFRIPLELQHRALFFGVLSALVLRAALIFAGSALLEHFHALVYVFGAFLIFTGVKLFLDRNKAAANPQDGHLIRFLRRVVPTTPELHGDRFFVRGERNQRVATPLFLALAVLELSDIVFALDSIPAIFAVTLDPFLVFTSNIFAMLGLRSLFFVLADAVERFRHLKIGLAGVLVFVGLKMAGAALLPISPFVSLVVVVTILLASILASLRPPRLKPVNS